MIFLSSHKTEIILNATYRKRTMTKWDTVIVGLLAMTREHEHAPAWALAIKLSEEVGELSEIMLHELGHLHHKDKEWKDTPVEESADIINVILGLLAVHYPDTKRTFG